MTMIESEFQNKLFSALSRITTVLIMLHRQFLVFLFHSKRMLNAKFSGNVDSDTGWILTGF